MRRSPAGPVRGSLRLSRHYLRARARLRSRRLDAADQLVELIRGVADVMRQAADHLERALGLADFQKLADEILVLLQRLQKPGELRTGIVKFLGSGFGLALQLLPLPDQILPLLRLEAGVLLQLFELVVDVAERLDAELRYRPVIGDGAEQRRHLFAQLIDLGARLGDVAGAIDARGAVLDALVQIRNAFLEILELLGELVDRRRGIAGFFGAGEAAGEYERRRHQRQCDRRQARANDGYRFHMTHSFHTRVSGAVNSG